MSEVGLNKTRPYFEMWQRGEITLLEFFDLALPPEAPLPLPLSEFMKKGEDT